MQHKLLKVWIIILIALTLGTFVWHKYGMNTELVVSADTELNQWTYDDRERGGSSVAFLQKIHNELVLTCAYTRDYIWPFCGFNIDTGDSEKGVDMSKYQTMEVDLRISDDAKKGIRVFMRTYDPVFSRPDEFTSQKVHELHYRPLDEVNPFVIELEKFQVATWWVNEEGIPPKYSEPDLTNVVNIGFGVGQNEDAKTHQIFFKSIKFHGKWISYSDLQSIIIASWIGSAVIYLLLSFWVAQKAVRIVKLQKKQLEEVNNALMLERDELENLATRDSLTGIYNRVGLRNYLHAQVSLVKQNRSELSIILMDIDKYKQVNDLYGHDVGDEVLFVFAALIKNNIRNQDLFCRWGGDEFLLLCNGTPLNAAILLAEKLRFLVKKHKWPEGIKLSGSFGVAQMDPDEDIGRFIKRADQSLYEAKAAGRNCVKPDLQSHALKLVKTG